MHAVSPRTLQPNCITSESMLLVFSYKPFNDKTKQQLTIRHIAKQRGGHRLHCASCCGTVPVQPYTFAALDTLAAHFVQHERCRDRSVERGNFAPHGNAHLEIADRKYGWTDAFSFAPYD